MNISKFFFIAMLSDVIPKDYLTGFEEKLALSFLWLHVFVLPNGMLLEPITIDEYDLE